MGSVGLSSGTLDYEDSGGDGSILVLVPGLLMNATVWRDVVARLTPEHRCIVPVMPLGGHRRAMDPDADLSIDGQAELLAEFMEALDLHDVVLVALDWGGPQITAVRHPERLAGLVLLPEEAFDNIPPGLPGKFAGFAGRLPGGVFAAVQSLRLPYAGRLPMTFGWMTKRPIPREILSSWIAGARHDRGVRGDLAKYVRTSDYEALERTAQELARFDRPTLVLWASEDRVMPPAHGRRLAEIIPDARHVEVDDTYTLIPLDRPDAVAQHIAAFVTSLARP